MLQNLAELRRAAHTFIAELQPNLSAATIVTLSGELGAGKTAFTQEVARALGVKETVSSPTFVIEKIYELTDQKWARLIHIDAYRLKGPDDMAVLGWHELAAEPRSLIVLEWPERVPGAIPETAVKLRFEIRDDGRIITSNGHEIGTQEGNGGEKSGA